MSYRLELEPIAPDSQGLSAHLTSREREEFSRLKIEKRRREWLAGRIAAKRLVRKTIEEAGLLVDDDEISIERSPNGAPFVRAERKPWPLSISHSGQWATAAMAHHSPLSVIGVDIEKVEDRDPAWLEIAFDASEGAADLDAAERTRLWTRKEAVLKLLGIGLSADLRDVRFPAQSGALELQGQAKAVWESMGSPRITFAALSVCPGYELTVAYAASNEEEVPHGR